MSLKFEIENLDLIRRASKNEDDLFCSFLFVTHEWDDLEKYVIFWDSKGKSTIRYLGVKRLANCPLPEYFSNELYFYVQIYATDNIKTKKVKVLLNKKGQCEEKEKEETNINIKFNDIQYKNNQLLLYKNNNLVKTINIVDNSLIQKILAGFAPEYIVDVALSPESTNPLSNKAIYKALLEKTDRSEFDTVAFSGDYNDLKNIPEEFEPKQHNHHVVDVVDYDENIDADLNRLLNALYDELIKE